MYTTLAEVEYEDLARFLSVFATEGRSKRAAHGSLGAEVLSTEDGSNRVIVLIDWRDEEVYRDFLADPTVPPTMARGGAKGRPKFTPVSRVGRFAA
ncbi:antibiotic biosynthesis monooxygenase [Pinisolibacter aquiterrae]|uniref:antibiotic biosynthesis monooxygenase n=1 Tax=Pinisolibacter aquiterrae TaxID=2815579 RepID=UPI001C3CD860|nr:antibiotic biosynthesis monooxygenase [Pinisolibacter aquiterrae]MBV5266907.1 antibiotic biosynthesis monooxygenase [Pinisolibacter aquiterrae]MCC8234782.1 antibiotic biosynthesis monooxygenase [Pinisolibacter aquiterrae]